MKFCILYFFFRYNEFRMSFEFRILLLVLHIFEFLITNFVCINIFCILVFIFSIVYDLHKFCIVEILIHFEFLIPCLHIFLSSLYCALFYISKVSYTWQFCVLWIWNNTFSVVVFNLQKDGNISRALVGEQIGTLIDQTGKQDDACSEVGSMSNVKWMDNEWASFVLQYMHMKEMLSKNTKTDKNSMIQRLLRGFGRKLPCISSYPSVLHIVFLLCGMRRL